MRLTKLKLSGFKSFVDPTSVLFPGQLVGVVGPNGCGKSNVIDAVRWVLGESKATALRGESMQDVIFNGSSNRKPISRASVELVFDNALGRAAGQWSQYAEIAVKRVLERNGDSTYHINGSVVRRRDVIDLFLGTGLGPRAYAIIEQGMISRIIEAKPEELRLFLEEAAGVTKYKERRRETENRLEDARENLARVQDIRGELDDQIVRLEEQAEVARQYRALQAEHADTQSLLWLLKRNDARNERERVLRDVERTALKLEAETANLRQTERKLEEERERHDACTAKVQDAQGDFYAAGSEVSRLESELQHIRQARQRLEARMAQLESEEAQWRDQEGSLTADRARWGDLLANARQRVAAVESRHRFAAERVPQAERARQEADLAVVAARRELAQAEQQLGVQEAHRASALRALESLAQRRQRLEGEGRALERPDEERLARLQDEARAMDAEVDRRNAETGEMNARLPELQTRQRLAADGERAAQHRLTEVRARRDALAQLQRRLENEGELSEWLARSGLGDREPLWRVLRVEAGWEVAVEAVLRERVSALQASGIDLRAMFSTPAPATVAFAFAPAGATGERPAMSMEVGLAEKIQCDDSFWRTVLSHWLDGVFVADDIGALVERRSQLGIHEMWVDRAGRMLSRDRLVLYAPSESRTHGVFERQREISELDERIGALQGDLDAARQSMTDVEEALAALQDRMSAARRETQELQQRRHGRQVDILKLQQAVQRYQERRGQVDRDLAEVDQSSEFERNHQRQAEAEIGRCRELVGALKSGVDSCLSRLQSSDAQLRDVRSAAQSLDRELQEARFSERECAAKLEEIDRSLAVAQREMARVVTEIAAAREERSSGDEGGVEAQLQKALALRRSCEESLAAARDAMEGVAGELRALQEVRLKSEQSIAPMGERINDLRLREQAARMTEQQFEDRLAEAGVDEEALAPRLTREVKESRLQSELGRIAAEIEGLGAVNLAALEELSAARERKTFLDAQSEDLNQAITTLEDAIRRIDRETREQLRQTFEAVNADFGRLFPELFGGGEAKLILTGEEILDAGIQVMAHPPGKRNASIHLLSGGEKALTAIALVFALFQLNPAPFCMLDEVDAPLDDHNTERFCEMVRRMSQQTQFIFISHNKLTMELAEQLIGVTMQERGVSRVVEVDIESALRMTEEAAA